MRIWQAMHSATATSNVPALLAAVNTQLDAVTGDVTELRNAVNILSNGVAEFRSVRAVTTGEIDAFPSFPSLTELG